MSKDLNHTCHECGMRNGYPQAAFGTTIHCARCAQPTTVGEIYPHAAPAKTPVRRKQVASAPVHEPPSRPSMTFYYDGLNTKGYPVSGEIDEATRKEARARLEKMGYRSLRVTGKPPKKRTSKPRLTKRDPEEEPETERTSGWSGCIGCLILIGFFVLIGYFLYWGVGSAITLFR